MLYMAETNCGSSLVNVDTKCQNNQNKMNMKTSYKLIL